MIKTMWKTPPKAPKIFEAPRPHSADSAETKSVHLKMLATMISLGLTTLVIIWSFSKSPQILRALKSDTPTVTEIWSKFGHGFTRAETLIVTSDLLASLYLVEQEMNARSLLNDQDLTWKSLFHTAQVPSLFQMGPLDFLERSEVCVHNKRIFSRNPHPCERLRPLHRSLRQMSAFLTLSAEKILEDSAQRFADLPRKQTVALMIYFCGPKEAALYVRRGFKAPPDLTCSDLSMGDAIKRIKTYQRAFGRAQANPTPS